MDTGSLWMQVIPGQVEGAGSIEVVMETQAFWMRVGL